ncbi:hypothetical protein MTF65_16665 [Streptomyces sp. APSN-46.1]|uniref:hypothetical protein n=1 Tax=Streptomyces sp. APSN-46.1 TaxID=2929049 RepID=UPI001FB52AF7|nr:hypothetical protein [Streptomyces sp. APSN-46.1]MCJ1678939.1 hypothetical protein [Streptomyces sp. APSN-46.1]
MTLALPRAVTPGPEFLSGVTVSYALGRSGNPYAMMCHPEAHRSERYLYGIAAGLGLRAGNAYPRTTHVLYYVQDVWALDYGHPDTLLRLPAPPHGWALRAQRIRGAHIGVSLDPLLPAFRPGRRVLTGTVGYRADARIGLL